MQILARFLRIFNVFNISQIPVFCAISQNVCKKAHIHTQKRAKVHKVRKYCNIIHLTYVNVKNFYQFIAIFVHFV